MAVALVAVVVVVEVAWQEGVIRTALQVLLSFGTHGQFETIQRRLAWPLH
jgi:hypothetical protein